MAKFGSSSNTLRNARRLSISSRHFRPTMYSPRSRPSGLLTTKWLPVCDGHLESFDLPTHRDCGGACLQLSRERTAPFSLVAASALDSAKSCRRSAVGRLERQQIFAAKIGDRAVGGRRVDFSRLTHLPCNIRSEWLIGMANFISTEHVHHLLFAHHLQIWRLREIDSRVFSGATSTDCGQCGCRSLRERRVGGGACDSSPTAGILLCPPRNQRGGGRAKQARAISLSAENQGNHLLAGPGEKITSPPSVDPGLQLVDQSLDH